ncbi:CG12811 [Drosophila busckii]|uniref:CG12811 n=1 Tax=Drosophila busckii TaxID=30019 RepID=A0A0M3QXT0_DROBS|nr:uncharacterized protein LOC108604561 [Drosophila busckii]ALC46463.1 CG12811 [Drosophila busckii]
MLRLQSMLLLTLFVAIIGMGIAQIAFVEDADIDKKKSNLAGRKPLYTPARCPHYQLLYPGDQPNDWICDCAPATLFYPDTDACYPAYRQGPCEQGQMLVLYQEQIIPECVSNPCRQDGYFMIKDRCYQFGNSSSNYNPCPNKDYTFVLGVNPKTLMVDCVQLSMALETRFGQTPNVAPVAPPEYHIELAEKCARGSKLSAQGKCVPAK